MTGLRGWKLVILIVVVLASSSLAFAVQNDYQMQVLFRIALFAALGLGWNIVGGYAGQLSLGHVAFFGIGAYSLALLTKHSVPLWVSVLLGAIIATAFAAVIGRIMFRLRGPYFTLSTIAAAEVLRLIATNSPFTEGAIGVATPALFTGRYFWKLFYLSAVTLATLTFLINFWVSQSRFGYYLMAIREDEDTASAVGIDTASYKNRSLLISAFVTALGGSLYASAFQFIIPDNVLTIDISLQMAIITMLGGAGTLLGPVVGAILLLSASELFKNRFKESHLLIYGILIVVVVLFLPEGIVGGIKQLWNWIRKKKAPASAGATTA
ncbi:MAG TPA: branched-chain amino acid ABC transporter permease [Candidatus Angelobacter sp.]